MAIVQISKIIHRTGANSDLPQLDAGEIGFASDEQKLYIGNDSILHPVEAPAVTTQTEIITEVSEIHQFNETTLIASAPISQLGAERGFDVSSLATGEILVADGGTTTANVWKNWTGTLLGPGANVKLQLGNPGNIKLTGGVNGAVLQTDGDGNLTWTTSVATVTIPGSPGGANTQVQFNDEGDFGGIGNLTFDKVTKELTLTGNIAVSNAALGNLATANYFSGNFYGHSNTASTVTTAAQPNITSVGTLTSLDSGDITSSGNISAPNIQLSYDAGANMWTLFANTDGLYVTNSDSGDTYPITLGSPI